MAYTVALYLRYSNDDGNTAENESIKNQRDLLNRFISGHEDFKGCTVTEFADDGYTGVNFTRPGFTQMMDAVKQKKIDCIAVKDFSRFGRNYVDVSDYIDQIFPFLGVRFISVNDRYDSKTTNAALGLDMSLKNLVYDLYSRDLSKKIKSARKTLMRKGAYIAPFAMYGYKKTLRDRKRLEVDPPAANVVKRIFDQAAEGVKARMIAMRLNSDGVLTPNEYAKSNSSRKKHYVGMDSMPLWTADIIRRIVQDERYLGKMVTNKYTSVKRKVTLIPKDEWIVVPATHEAIVSEGTWKKAQGIFRTRKEIIMPVEPKSVLTGMLKCGHCKKTLVLESRRKSDHVYFYCHNFNMGYGCKEARIEESILISILYTAIRKKLDLVQAAEPITTKRWHEKLEERKNRQRRLELKLKNAQLSQETALEQYMEDKITKGQYLTQKKETAEVIIEISQQLTALGELDGSMVEYVERHRPFYTSDVLTRDMVKALIKKVIIYSADSIEIIWMFAECYHELQALMAA